MMMQRAAHEAAWLLSIQLQSTQDNLTSAQKEVKQFRDCMDVSISAEQDK
jgi:hypothetical protein